MCTYPDAATGLTARKPDTASSLRRAFHSNLLFITIKIIICFTFF